MKIKRISWREAVELCYKLASRIAESDYRPDAVVVVLRGGLLPALIISDYLGIEDFYAIRVRHWGIGGEVYREPVIEWVSGDFIDKKLLIVDEVVDTGKTLHRVVEELYHRGAAVVKTAVLHVKPTTIYVPDYYVEKLDEWIWIFYPWSLIETLYNLATSRGNNVWDGVEEVIEEIGLRDIPVKYIRRGIMNYLSRKNG